MRIAVDARELHGRPTGVGRYLSRLLEEWRRLPAAQAHEFVLLAPESSAGGTRWEQATLPGLVRRAGAHVLFAPAYTAPLLCPAPVVLTVHDVSFWAHPEWFSGREGVRRRWLTRWAAHTAARVLTVSEFSKREIVAHLRVPPSRVEVVHSGVVVPPTAPSTTVDEGTTATRDGVLFVGSIFNRRHVPELIAAFALVAARHPGVRLDLVGDNRTSPRVDVEALAQRSGHAARIGLHAYVSDETLVRLYGGARVFVFLSDYEGFGFTPLEALASGVPIVVLDTPVAREIYGDAAVFVTRPDPSEVASAIERVLFDEAVRAALLTAAARLLPRYSWRDAAARTLEAIVAHGD